VNIPLAITSGFKTEWEEVSSDYPSPEFTLHYKLINDKRNYTIAGTASDGVTTFTVSTDLSKQFTADTYRAYLIAKKDGEFYNVGKTYITIHPDPTSNSSIKIYSTAEKMVKAIDAVLEKRADRIQQSYSVAGRALQYMSFDELISARSYYQAVVEREKQEEAISNGKRKGNNILLRFSKC
jgi:hypothetical protein